MISSGRSHVFVMMPVLEQSDIQWRQITNEVKLDLAQRIFDARAGHTPSHYRKMLEHVMGVPFHRLAMVIDRLTGRVIDVHEVDPGTAAAMLFMQRKLPAAA